MTALLPLEEAQARLLALASPLPVEHIAVEEAAGYYLAAPLLASRTQPAADVSAMDGYAVAGGSLTGPWRVIGESAAGHPSGETVTAGDAVRISTGALMPPGAGAVILQEDLARTNDMIALTGKAPHPADRHIRRRGMDFVEGASLLPGGTRIGPAQIALGIAAGHTHLPVHRAAQVAILDCGDELARPDEPCLPHRIPASNGAMLAAMLAAAGPCRIARLGPVPDRLDAFAAAFAGATDADIIVTSGGASVGDHDLVRPALAAWGAKLDFWKVAIKPGKPLLVATRETGDRRQLIVGLPGNPASSLVTAHLFLLPVLRALLGAGQPLPPSVTASLAAPLPAGGARREFRRARWNGTTVDPTPEQDSGALAALAASNALIDIPASGNPRQAGDMVTIFPL